MVQEQQQPALAADPSSNPSSNADWLLRHYELCMIAAEAAKDTHRQWVYFKAFQYRLINRMDSDSRKVLDVELADLYQKEYEIQQAIENKTNQEAALHELYQVFIKTHLAYLYLTLVRAGETPITETAQLDFNKQEYDTIKAMVTYSRHGLTENNRDIKLNEPGETDSV